MCKLCEMSDFERHCYYLGVKFERTTSQAHYFSVGDKEHHISVKTYNDHPVELEELVVAIEKCKEELPVGGQT